jgi:hypothetical protein
MTGQQTTKQRHVAYYKGSPFYKAVYDRFGRTLTRETADSICRDHSTTLNCLAYEEGLVIPVSGRVQTLDLIEALNY